MVNKIRVELTKVLIRETTDHHVVELTEVGGRERQLGMAIGLMEAAAIERRAMGHEPLRPQTHDLLASVIEAMGGTLTEVLINDHREDAFFARMRIQQGDHLLDIDSRPSDALALAVASDVPIYVAEPILDEANKAV